MQSERVIEEIPNLYRIMAMEAFRRTKGVFFDKVTRELIPRINGIDRVIHENGARSPGPVGDVNAPWYMHPHQEDNLMVVHGMRQVDLYTREKGRIETFSLTPNRIEKDGMVLFEGPVILGWPRHVYHRILSSRESGSASINFAVRYDGFDIRTNFNIYDVDTQTGSVRLVREGHLDQQ